MSRPLLTEDAVSNHPNHYPYVIQVLCKGRWFDTNHGAWHIFDCQDIIRLKFRNCTTRIVRARERIHISPRTKQHQPNNTMQFDKNNVKKVATMKGRKPSKWDGLADILREPGDTYYFNEEEVSRSTCAQAASRLRYLTDRPYHSGYDAKEEKTFIRLRFPEELSANDASDEEE